MENNFGEELRIQGGPEKICPACGKPYTGDFCDKPLCPLFMERYASAEKTTEEEKPLNIDFDGPESAEKSPEAKRQKEELFHQFIEGEKIKDPEVMSMRDLMFAKSIIYGIENATKGIVSENHLSAEEKKEAWDNFKMIQNVLDKNNVPQTVLELIKKSLDNKSKKIYEEFLAESNK